MKKKELKNLAQRIAKAERIIQTTTDSNAKYKAEQDVMMLSNQINSTEDMVALDEMIQEILSKN